MEDWITIRNLKKRNPNTGTRAIVKNLGLSRKTVKNALQSEDPTGNLENRRCIKFSNVEDFSDNLIN